MRYLVTKIKLKDINKEVIINKIFRLHQIEYVSLDDIMTSFSSHWIIHLDDILAFHIEQYPLVYEYIYNDMDKQLYVSLDYRYLNEHIDIIDDLMKDGYIDDSEYFYIKDEPFMITSSHRFIQFIKNNQSLPVVLLKRQYPSIAVKLASLLKGMAYVVICDSKDIEGEIYDYFHLSQHSYIIYLNQEFQKISLFKHEDNDQFIERIFIKVQNYITKRVYAFPYSIEKLYRHALNLMIDDVKQSEDNVTIILEDQLSQLENQIKEYEEKIEKIKQKLSILEVQNENNESYLISQEVHPLIIKGDEKELYEGEQKDMLIYLLEKEYKNTRNTEVQKIIENILQDNAKIGKRDQLLKEIESILIKSQQLNTNILDKLRKCGICLEKSNGNHYDGCFFDDKRYTLTVASSPSDMYFNKQTVRNIKKFFF